MPAQKLPLEDPPLNDAVNHQLLQQQLQQQQNEDVVDGDDNEQQQQQEQQDEDDEDEDDDEEEDEAEEDEEEDGGELDDDEKSQSSSSDDDVDDAADDDNDDEDDDNVNKEEFILVRLSDIRKEVQCPICLGIIRKTRTVMECLHRFCRECIDKSMRMGNNECPACRTHCASRRSLRDDPNYDAIISAIYPDIDQYEEEELAFQEDERVRNKQIQAAIAQTFRRQTEALSRKRRRSGNSRKRRNYRSEEDDEANGHDGGKDSSSADERCTEPKPKRPKRWRGQPSPAGASGDGGGDENDQEVQREVGVAPAALIGSTEMLVWGKGGIRSNTRYGSGSGGNGKTSRSRLAKLHEHLRNLDDNEMDIQVVLVSLDQKEPLLEHSYLCGRPALSVGQLCQFIALQTSLPPEKLEILAARSTCSKASSSPTMQVQTSTSTAFDSSKDELQVLDSKETLAGLKAACNFARGHLLLAYRQKL